ncbi:isomerase [Leptolyngbya sp. BL0902]|uniref:PhzF family phenazine biosynthesis protein n=1 Tax=Leptolyngbya sp. BL0902 TaxID=1115757 RepID=UPI0018E8E83F|nr:PhzF family phenazine biosynthesis protein [Leptolyngbya sp. BL0902]QQE65991.1 isomerase [Leptolyngbya sp. BL0902]
MSIPLFQVDAFTDRPFGGNPAAVCILPEERPAAWMQRVAQEMNLSETAFVYPEAEGYRLRWFTPTTEVDLCGHATLATSHVLWSEGYLAPPQTALFHTRSGLLTARRFRDWIELDFPTASLEAISAPPDLAAALGAEPQRVMATEMGYLVEVATAEVVRQLQPDVAALQALPVPGVIVTSLGEPPYDFVSRFFAPNLGIPEDPVTGSAHCSLSPYWRDRLGQTRFLAYQASDRGGVVKVQDDSDRVRLSGQAVTVLRGELLD